MSTIQILLATYQGASFLDQQIESLLTQDYPHVHIVARDDGSTDATPDILATYAQRGVLRWTAGENLGVKRSFYRLLTEVDDAFAYAFCDQDDVWMPDKLSRAAQHLQQHPATEPVLYFTHTALVDANLQLSNPRYPIMHKPPAFGNALVQNVVVGCTLVMNHTARLLLTRIQPDWDAIRMHDWWAYLVISAHGTVIYDPYASVYYRQHGNNQVGSRNRAGQRWQRTLNPTRIITRQAAELQRCYSATLPLDQAQLLTRFLGKVRWSRRIQLVFDDALYRQRTRDHLIFKLLLLFNRL